ncbi:MAG: hypothetical protein ACJZ9G_12075 [Rhodospirillales bacterium]|tara:strand:+ start:174 stop:356 length:183 start_codon:yes stop_codon:yes gene_type:complete
MRYSIQQQTTSGEWLVFDTGGSAGLVCQCRSEEEAMLEVLRLEEKSRTSSYNYNSNKYSA